MIYKKLLQIYYKYIIDMKVKHSNKYFEFNSDQVIPIVNDLNLAKKIIQKILCSLDEYVDSLHQIQNQIKNCSFLSDEIKVKIDKNVTCLLINFDINLNQMIEFKNFGGKKEKIFDRLKRGISYKYKLCNGSIVENPELLKFDVLRIDCIHRTLEIGNKIFQFSDSSDYIPDGGSDSCPLELRTFVPLEIVIDDCTNKFQLEIQKTLIIKSYLDVLLVSLEYAYNIIITDIEHFNLLDKNNLESILLESCE